MCVRWFHVGSEPWPLAEFSSQSQCVNLQACVCVCDYAFVSSAANPLIQAAAAQARP